MRIFLLSAFIVFSCTQKLNNENSNNKIIFTHKIFNSFKNLNLFEILVYYNLFLNSKFDDRIDKQPIRIDFYISKEKDTLITLSTGKYLPIFIDSNYNWLYYTKFNNKLIYVSDYQTDLISDNFLNLDLFVKLKKKQKNKPTNMFYDEILFDGRYIRYKIVDGDLKYLSSDY